MTQQAASTCAASFATGLSEKTSSARPARKRIVQPATIPSSSLLAGAAPIARHAPSPAAKPAKMPTPPSSGVERVCQRSSRGAATTRRPSGERTTAQITNAVTGRATATTANLTCASQKA